MRIISGIQPTGEYHIGNYLGALKQWAELQYEHESFFFIADLHALTTIQDPAALKQSVLEKAVELLAVGMDPERCNLFIQSHIPGHTELAWILNTITGMGELNRMTQYKDKAQKGKEAANLGLFAYPVLQAADILLYKSEGVPIGKDQAQHLELTRVLANRFNKRFGQTFPEPQAILPAEGAKILSLKDPKKKMSKSDAPDTRISLFEDPDSIRKKIAKAVTDTGKEITYNPAKRPAISNLLLIYALFSDISPQEAAAEWKNKSYASFKKSLAELLVDKLEVFRKRKQSFSSREVYIQEILARGARKASTIAELNLQDIRDKAGLLNW